MDDSVSKTIQIILPNGTKKCINRSGEVSEVLKNYCMDDKYENYALVFFGRKLALNQKLENLQHLNKNPAYIICQNNHQISSNNERSDDITKKLKSCRASYRALIEDALPQVSAEAFKLLISYMHENNCERYKNEVIRDFPNIINDQLGDAAICDFRLLIQFIMKNDEFSHKHPECLSIFKKALDNVSTKFSSTSTSVRFPISDNIPHQQNNASSGNLITQQMLSQAFAVALGDQPTASQQSSTQANNPQTVRNENNPNFSTQLQQMHEFGFTDDAENIQALLLTNGDVEQALQIVIAMRE